MDKSTVLRTAINYLKNQKGLLYLITILHVWNISVNINNF